MSKPLLAFALCLALGTRALAQDELPQLESPYASLVREQYYEELRRSPVHAAGWELLFPGAGNAYVGLWLPAAATLAASMLGASLWVAGAASDRPALKWSGVGTFAGARVYGLVSAPVGALLLNAAFRQQLGIAGTY